MPTAVLQASNSGGRDAASSSSNSSDAPSALPDFVFLPQELRTYILELACQLPAALGKPQALTILDVPTALNVALASREFHTTAVKKLYAHVRLLDLSAMRKFEPALRSRISILPRMVRSLHLGPEDELPEHWWPISFHCSEREEPGAHLKTSLWDNEEEGKLLPLWFKRPGRVCLERPPQDCQDLALVAAIDAAIRSINIDLAHKRMDAQGRVIGLFAWCRRVFDVQGLLDLYLLQMRRIDDRCTQSGSSLAVAHLNCRSTRCAHYPRLVFTDTPSKTSQKKTTSRSTFVVTRQDLDYHLYRRGAATANFDHPLTFARSGRTALALPPGGADTIVKTLLGGPITVFDFAIDPLPNEADESPSSSEDEDIGGFSGLHLDDSDEDTWPANSGTFAEVMALSRSILSLTNVSNLSLSSQLHVALCGPNGPPQKALRAFSLGPTNPHWEPIFDISNGRMENLEMLRISGVVLSDEEAEWISTRRGMSRLKFVQWAMAALPPEDLVHDLLVILQGRAGAQFEAAFLGIGRSRAQQQDTPPLFVEVYLVPSVAREVLDMAATPEQRDAWRLGHLAPGASNRVRVIECNLKSRHDPDSPIKPPFGQIVRDAWFLHAEAKKWWEERAMEGRWRGAR